MYMPAFLPSRGEPKEATLPLSIEKNLHFPQLLLMPKMYGGN